MQPHSTTYNPYTTVREVSAKAEIEAGEGENIVLTGADMVSMKIQEGIDPLLTGLPMRKLTLEAYNKDSRLCSYSISESSTVSKFVGKLISTQIGINGEYIDTGKFYIDSIENKTGDIIVKIIGYCIIKGLSNTLCLATALHGSTYLSTQIVTYAGLNEICYVGFKNGAGDKLVSCPENNQATNYKDLIKNLSSAAGCWAKADRSNAVIFNSWEINVPPAVNSITIDRNDYYGAEGLKASSAVDLVRVSGKSANGQFAAYAGQGKFSVPSPVYDVSSSWVHSSQMAKEIADKLIRMINAKLVGEIKYRGDPTIEAGDSVYVEIYSGGASYYWHFLVEEATLDYDGSLSGKLKLRTYDSNYAEKGQ